MPGLLNTFDPAPLNCDVFSRLQVVTYPKGGTLIAWGLKPGFKAKGPYHFYVDFGRSGSTEWEVLNATPVVDDCLMTDLRQRYFDHLADYYYRVRLVLPNVIDQATAQPTVYLSQPHQANGYLSKRDWLIARDIVRREYLMQNKRTNITDVGWLLKRRRYGQSCTKCKEPDTGEVQQSHCDECYGTGFVGGYFRAVDFRFTTDAPWAREFKRDATVGNTNNVAKRGRAVAYPYLDTNDVYVRRSNGERYFINEIQTAAEVGGVPILVSAELRLAPVTDVIYTVPVSGGSSSSSEAGSSSSGSPDQEWRKGLNDDHDW